MIRHDDYDDDDQKYDDDDQNYDRDVLHEIHHAPGLFLLFPSRFI
jgi:hypothetical protein